MTESESTQSGFSPNQSQQVVDAISHDFRAPARHVKSFAQLLEAHLGNGIDEESKEYLDLIGSAAEVIHAKLNALPPLSWASTACLVLEPLRSYEILEEALAGLAPNGCESLVIDATGLTATVLADRELLVAVFVELIGNSKKFCETAGVITITSHTERGRCVITVADDGPGFLAKDPATAFNLFKRYHDRSHPGTGTGLTVVRTILHRHRSEVTIESDANAGTTVTFTLALADDLRDQ